MAAYQLQELKKDDPAYVNKLDQISLEKKNKTAQYISEGTVFLLVILVGAFFLFRAILRHIRIQQQQQNFMMAVTHELKTPIAVTKLNLETIQKYKLDENKQSKILRSSLQEINRLDSLANNILISAQLEGGYYQLAREDLDFSQITLAASSNFRDRNADRNWNIDIDAGIHLIGDRLLLAILVNNLIENAVKYSPKSSSISISLKKEANHVNLKVKDEGPGISANERKKIFRKFYRIGNEETRTSQGTGLGLYLCRKIASDHQARIVVSNNSPVGSIFTVSF
ncbi:MAG: two-component sensor histidine kinase [Bacteroidetes bacterium]|nr:MAG: two-component sensor histidine kinase [Bacteroidota bacterium]